MYRQHIGGGSDKVTRSGSARYKFEVEQGGVDFICGVDWARLRAPTESTEPRFKTDYLSLSTPTVIAIRVLLRLVLLIHAGVEDRTLLQNRPALVKAGLQDILACRILASF